MFHGENVIFMLSCEMGGIIAYENNICVSFAVDRYLVDSLQELFSSPSQVTHSVTKYYSGPSEPPEIPGMKPCTVLQGYDRIKNQCPAFWLKLYFLYS